MFDNLGILFINDYAAWIIYRGNQRNAIIRLFNDNNIWIEDGISIWNVEWPINNNSITRKILYE